MKKTFVVFPAVLFILSMLMMSCQQETSTRTTSNVEKSPGYGQHSPGYGEKAPGYGGKKAPGYGGH